MGNRRGWWVVVLVGVLSAACGGSADSTGAVAATTVSTRVVEVTTAMVATVAPPTATVEPTVSAVIEAVATAPSVVVEAPAQPVPTQTPLPPAPTATIEAPSRPPPVTVAMVLNLRDRSFTPHQIHGNAGDTVALTFTGGTEAHTFTVTSLGIDVAIGARETKQFSFVMPVEGEVSFFCRLHGSATTGMHGLLIFH